MSIYDEWCCLQCGECKFFQVDADRRSETTCKRLDHKKYKFAVPWFKSYDCGQFSQCVCSDFEPAGIAKWLKEHWTTIEDYIAGYEAEEQKSYFKNQYVPLCVDGNTDVRYYVKKEDYFYNNYLDSNGNLKWVKKCYYKRTPKSVTGYKLIWEYNDEAN